MSASKDVRTPRYVVGIDLGTTHCALAYADLAVDAEPAAAEPAPAATARRGRGDPGAQTTLPMPGAKAAPAALSTQRGHAVDLSVPQLVAQASVESRTLLPSFVYFAHESDGKLALPWDKSRRFAVGEYARTRGVEAPARLISSAKSWLSHAGIDRRSAVLPLGAPEDIEKISPVEASFRYLEHLSEAWDATVAKGDPALKLAEQEVVITVPASFDAGARELTVEAATAAGIEHLTLLEEPQAALYAWIDAMGEAWRKEIKVGDVILVVDVGGGTTDFSAIAALEKDGSLELARVAVGEHILLGGDNMDLALAHVVRAKLEAEGKEVDRWQMASLTYACRVAKETMFGDESLASCPIVVAARGSKLLGGGLRAELTREDLTRTLVDGYFPEVTADARPAVRPRAALTQIGLPYAQDAAVTRHLAAFLGRQADAVSKLDGFPAKGKPGALLHPTAIVFNGGVMKANALRARVESTIASWLEKDGAPRPRVLQGSDLDLAVARGAAAYGLARRGRGLRIRGGTARAYYVGIESPAPAVPGVEPPITLMCIAPFGMEEGTEAKLPAHELGVVVGEKVRFRFFGSSVRRADGAGAELERWKEGEVVELSPIEVTLPPEGRAAGDVVPVRLNAKVTEVGTLLLEALPVAARAKDERWKIELSVRDGATGPQGTEG